MVLTYYIEVIGHYQHLFTFHISVPLNTIIGKHLKVLSLYDDKRTSSIICLRLMVLSGGFTTAKHYLVFSYSFDYILNEPKHL
jgi:hypothetical protein